MPSRPTYSRRADLTEGAISPHLTRLTLPMVVGILAMFAFNMVDTYFVAQLGTLPLASIAVTFPLVMVMTSIALGLGVSTSIAVSQTLGRGAREEVPRLVTDAFTLAVLLTLLLMAIGYAWLDRALDFIGGSLPTHDLAAAYLRIWLLGYPFVMLTMVGNMAVRATGDTVTPSVFILVGVGVNAVMDPLLIFGPGPFPALGIAGAAWATVLGRGLSLLAVLWVMLRRDRMFTTPWADPRRILASWKRLIRNGAPIALNNLITPVIAGGLTRLIAGMGTAAVAGFGIASRLESLAFTGIYALQSVIGIYVGQNAGADKWGRVETGLRKCERFGLYWGFSVLLLMALLGRTLAAWFDPDPEVISAAYCYAVVAGLGFGWRGVYLLGSAGLNSLNYAAAATTLTVIQGIGITLPCAWWLGRHWGLPGICAGVAVGSVISGIATSIVLRRKLAHRRRHGLG